MLQNLRRAVCLAFCLMILAGCAGSTPQQQMWRYQFFGVFDTFIQVTGYAASAEEFDAAAKKIQSRYEELNMLYDRFNDYDGVSNIKTINDNAGIAPVTVSEEIIGLLEFCREWYQQTGGQVNIAMGPVLSIWHDAMQRYSGSENGVLPDESALRDAAELTDFSKVVIDRENSTVFLEEEGMMLDVGAVAKGYATQKIAEEIFADGFSSFLISAGGNVTAADPPADGSRSAWGIAIQNPFAGSDDSSAEPVDVVYLSNASVVTSGDYERFYTVDGVRYCHIIDPQTLYPAHYYRSVTIADADGAVADLASTTLFTLPYDRSRALADEMNWKALWVFADGSVECTDSMLPLLRDCGGASNR